MRLFAIFFALNVYKSVCFPISSTCVLKLKCSRQPNAARSSYYSASSSTVLFARKRRLVTPRQDEDLVDDNDSNDNSLKIVPEDDSSFKFSDKEKVLLPSVKAQLEEDISYFRRTGEAQLNEEAENIAGVASNTAKNILSTVMIVDFFVVIFFLGWFLLAAALQSTNAFLLEKFQDIFQPVVVPCLTVLMVGSIASGLLDKKKE